MTTSELIRAALAWLATYAVHSTLFLGLAFGLDRLRRPRLERNRERVWKLALVGGVLSATLQCALGARAPFGHVEWQGQGAARPAEQAEAVPAPSALPAPTVAATRADKASPPSTARPAPAGAERAPRTRAARPRTAPATRLALGPGEALDVLPIATRFPPTAPGPAQRGTPAPLDEPAPLAGTRPAGPDTSAGTSGGLTALSQTVRARWHGWVLAAWTGAGLLGLLGFALSWAALRRHLLGREQLVDGPLVAMLARLAREAGLRRRVRLSVSTRIATPFSTGWLRPEICLPRAVASALSPAQQEALLAHELAHVVRRDPAWFALGFLLERLFFFQPLNRLARRQLAELAEVACDDWAVRWTGARLALASCLTEVAGWSVAARPRHAALPGLAGSRSRLGQRVERLLDDRRAPAGEPPAPWWPPVAAGALTLAVLTVPGVSAQPPRPAPLRTGAPLRATSPSSLRASPEAILSASMPVEPAPVADPGPARLAADLASQHELASELLLLEAELTALRAELEARDLHERFEAPLSALQARLEELRHQHAQAEALIRRLAASLSEPPTGGPTPPAAGPAPTALPRESR
ncbi:MAG TPA: M56 family metallopeptidase [Planctomycetota bacterium]